MFMELLHLYKGDQHSLICYWILIIKFGFKEQLIFPSMSSDPWRFTISTILLTSHLQTAWQPQTCINGAPWKLLLLLYSATIRVFSFHRMVLLGFVSLPWFLFHWFDVGVPLNRNKRPEQITTSVQSLWLLFSWPSSSLVPYGHNENSKQCFMSQVSPLHNRAGRGDVMWGICSNSLSSQPTTANHLNLLT